MSHGTQTAPILHSGPEPCHPEVRRRVRAASAAGVGDDPARSLRPTADSRQPIASARRALTLIEMLVALAVTLVMMAAVVNLFANISASISNRRAVIEVSGQLRQVRARLALDLAGATCNGKTWQRPGEDAGYIEIIEGQWSDMYPSELVDGVNEPDADPPNLEIDYATSLVPSGGNPMLDLRNTVPPLTQDPNPPAIGSVTNGRALGDWDDILALTVRSQSAPFVAFAGAERLESPLAEVVWFADENAQDNPTTPEDESSGAEPAMRRIYRNVLLILPGRTWPGGPNDRPNVPISVHYNGNNQWVSNSLGDLSKREYRAARDYEPSDADSLFPHLLERHRLDTGQNFRVLDDALAFDVRLYDPGAPMYNAGGGAVVQPGDPGWFNSIVGGTIVGFGAYCDLGWAWERVRGALAYPPAAPLPTGVPAPLFNELRQAGWHPMLTNADVALRSYPCVYDTWSFHYENDGIQQETVLMQWARQMNVSPLPTFNPWQTDTLDQGTNGLDDDGINGVDDPGERETAPPYDFPLRGVKVSLRIYERDARQIRETSVTHSFAN